MNGLFDLTGKTAVIVAGTSPLGYAMAEGMAEFGANVVITSRDLIKAEAAAKRLSEDYGTCAKAYVLDIENRESIARVFEQVKNISGSLDVLINNFASLKAVHFMEMDYEAWASGIDGTINGVFSVTKEALGIMLPQGRGNIINIASMYGVVSPNPEIYGQNDIGSPASYGAGKAAIIHFTKYIACHFGTKGIRANCISPGPFPREEARQNSQFMQKLSEKTALRRIGSPQEIKGVAVLLASDASSYITGQNYCVDGGWTAW